MSLTSDTMARLKRTANPGKPAFAKVLQNEINDAAAAAVTSAAVVVPAAAAGYLPMEFDQITMVFHDIAEIFATH